MEDVTQQSFLGTGWQFPPSFSRMNHSVRMSSDITDIEQSIHIILGTTPGERLMQPMFGCRTRNFVFEKVDINFERDISDAIGYALLMWEPRVKFINADVTHRNEVDGVLYLSIHFSVITTNTRHNIVYPFYVQEGTNLPDTA